jgi:3-carboxy-cis,cis-muconate cycloisomerase
VTPVTARPASEGDQLFTGTAHVEQMLRFEAALARAEGRAGIIPHEAATAIVESCRIERFDVPALERDALHAGTLAIPLVQQLIANAPPSARPYVHWGATSQDVIDTALVLQMRGGLTHLVADLGATGDALEVLADSHRSAVMPGRTLLQHAVPITFGLKAAHWLGAIGRRIVQLRALRRDALVLQFGGAAGTLAALGANGTVVAELLAEELELPRPDLPWHADRDRPAAVVAALGVTAGVIAKIARDLVLLAQTEVGEAVEGSAAGKGTSSAMPQKRNPVDATNAIARAQLAIGTVPVMLSAMAQEHERGAGGWQAEWTVIPDAFRHTMRAAAHLRSAIAGLDVRTERMRANLEQAGGSLMAESLSAALAPHVGRPEAMRLVSQVVERAFHERIMLHEAAKRDAGISALLTPPDVDRALDATSYLGNTNELIERALRSWRDVRQGDER